MIDEIKRNGGADGTLAYKISDILTQARDAHTDQVSWDLGRLSLVQVSPEPKIWLNLRQQEGSSDVEVVGNVVGSDGSSIVETKVVSTINGEDAFEFLKNPMVWKLPTFAGPLSVDDMINFWNAMVKVAMEKNITKLIIDISDNSGGSIANAYTGIGLLYPDAPYEDVVHWYTTRISEVMLSLGAVVPQFESIMDTLLLDENRETLTSFMKEVDVNDLEDGFASILAILANAGYLAVSAGDCGYKDFDIETLQRCLNSGGDDWYWMNIQYDSLGSVLDLADTLLNSDEGLVDGVDSEDVDIVFSFLENLKDSVDRPIYCNEWNETCNTQTNQQGGEEVLSSEYFRNDALDQDALRQVREFSIGNPFESYVLISNSQLVGSAANIFESALRHISGKYNETMPKTTGVSMGCLGEASQCDMTSFQGQILKGNQFSGSLYAIYGVLSALQELLDLLPESLVGELEDISQEDIDNYNQAIGTFLSQLPKPSAISSELPQFNSVPIYSLNLPKETIPQEYFNRPPDEYLPIWPAPQSVSFENQQSLPLIYKELEQFF